MRLFAILFLVPLAGMGIDLYTPSLPAISSALHASPAVVKLTLAIYLLGYGLGQPFFGTLSDRYGRKWPLLIGVALFFISSCFAALSTNITMLLWMRFLQGLSIASAGAIMKSIVTDSYDHVHLPKIATWMATCWALGPIVAPAVGGYLQHYLGWQAAFFALALYGLLGSLLVLIFIPETNQHKSSLSVSTILQNYTAVMRHRLFMMAVLGMALVYSLLVVFNAIAPFLIQVVLHFSAIDYGHIALGMGVAFFLGSFSNRILLNHFSPDKMLVLFINIGTGAALLMVILALIFPINLWIIIVPTAIIFYSAGIIFPNCMGRAMGYFKHIAGTANAIMGFLFVIATAVVTGFSSLFKSTSLMPLALIFLLLMLAMLLVKAMVVKKGISK